MAYEAMDSHRTLWMGNLAPSWNNEFITKAFEKFGHTPTSIKFVTDKNTNSPTGYCFVEFMNSEIARDAMLAANGHSVPNAEERVKFNLSFANDPKSPSIEYNLFANNLSLDMDDADLYQIFGRRYRSCRGAKVYRNQDGTSRGLGFARFGDRTEQQLALVEMNGIVVRGKTLQLKMAAAKQRLPRNQIRDGVQPRLMVDHPPMIIPQQISQPQLPVEYAYIHWDTAVEANNKLVADGDAWWEELEESRWSACITEANMSEISMCHQLAYHRW